MGPAGVLAFAPASAMALAPRQALIAPVTVPGVFARPTVTHVTAPPARPAPAPVPPKRPAVATHMVYGHKVG